MSANPHISVIICEYNPFHNGHAHHIAETRRLGATHIAAVMSGNFVQRGEPALFDKWLRARMALENGVDLVLELPTPWAMSSAEPFAQGGVALANAMGCASSLSFGSECGDLSLLQKAAQTLISPETQACLRDFLQEGLPYPLARSKALLTTAGSGTAEILTAPNNTLAVEYLIALASMQSPLLPFTISRKGAAHDSHSPDQDFTSASHLRSLLATGRTDALSDFMPDSAFTLLCEATAAQQGPACIHNAERAILSHLRRLTPEELCQTQGISEGLEHRLFHCIRASSSLDELSRRLKTKRYPLSRLRRLVLSAYLGIPAQGLPALPPYLRVLGFNWQGAEILRIMRTTARLPILMRGSDSTRLSHAGRQLFELESRATDLYDLFRPQPGLCGSEYTRNTVRLLERV